MKKAGLIIWVCLLCAVQALGQKIETKGGMMIQTRRPGNFIKVGVIHTDNKGYYVVWKQNSYPFKLILERYNPQHESVWEKLYEQWEKKHNGRYPEQIFWLKNQLVLYSEYTNAKTKIRYAYFQHLDESGEKVGEELLADSIQYDDNNSKQNSYFTIVCSEDSSRFMLTHSVDPGKNNGWLIRNLYLDADLKIVNNTSWQLPYEKMEIQQRKQDVNGNSFFLISVMEKSADDLWKLIILEDLPAKNRKNQYSLQSAETPFISTAELSFVPKKNAIICVGFYYSNESSRKGNISPAEGSFMATVPGESGKPFKISVKPFDTEFLRQMLTTKQAGKEYVLPQIGIGQVLIVNDSDVVLIGEQYQIGSKINNNGSGVYLDIWETIVCVRFGYAGQADWQTTIHRSHEFTGWSDYYADFEAWLSGERLMIRYYISDKEVPKMDKVLGLTQPTLKRLAIVNLGDGTFQLTEHMDEDEMR